jgi:DNA-binding transcriptional ArsR family regulator
MTDTTATAAPLITPELATDVAAAAKALSHPTKVEALGHMARLGPLSPSQISEIVGETGASLGTISYHVRQLVQLGMIELDHTTPRRGALEHTYRISKQGRSDLARLVETAAAIYQSTVAFTHTHELAE